MRSIAAFVLLLFAQSSGAAPGQVIFTESGVNRTVRVISNACVDVTRAANLWFEAVGYSQRVSSCSADPVVPGTNLQLATNSAPAVVPSVPSESNWRVVGYWGDGGVLNFYMSNGSGSRVFRPQNYKLTWMTSEVQLPDGSFATSWASALPSAPQLLGK